jgi:hypothetical protein
MENTMPVSTIKIEWIKIRLHPAVRMLPWDITRYPELNKKTLARLASEWAGPRYIKRGRIFHCKAGPEERLIQEVIIDTARACSDGIHEGGK